MNTQLTPSVRQLVRRWLGVAATLSLGLLGAGALFGPCMATTFVTPPTPLTRLTLPPRGLMHVEEFPDINKWSCVPDDDYPLHEIHVVQRGSLARYLWKQRMLESVMSCGRAWDGDMTVTASADEQGALTVRAVGTAPAAVRRCVERAVVMGKNPPLDGPGRMQVAYHMGARPHR